MSHPLPALIIAVVAVATGVLSVLAVQASRRVGDRRLLLLAGAFGLFCAKSALTSMSLAWDLVAHERLELANGLLDLAIVALLIAPLFRLRRR